MSTCHLLAFLFSTPSLPFSGLLSISSSLWAVLWPEPCSVDCLYSSMRGSHFRSPVTIPGGAAPLWLMLYKTFFFFFYSCDISGEISRLWTFLSACTSVFTQHNLSLTYQFVHFCCFLTCKVHFASVFFSIIYLPVLFLHVPPHLSAVRQSLHCITRSRKWEKENVQL